MFKKLILFSFLFGLSPFLLAGADNSEEMPDKSANPSAFVVEKVTEVKTGSGSFVSKVAPGEFLPVAVKLLNFGGGRRVDVAINYKIFDQNKKEILNENETVAVETTASFVKVLQLPHDLKPGRYKVTSEILYQGQEVPAVSSFSFTVERKFAGLFLSQLAIIFGIALVLGVILFYLFHLFGNRQKSGRIAPHDYSEISKDDRIFYEILSDIIAQMRLRIGDKAIEFAGDIDGFSIDNETGRIINVSKNPAKIIALLILRYEQELDEKISFGLRQTNDEAKEKIKPVDKNLLIIRKYFE
ncbi:MAG TPA: hypothetical protein VJ103_00515 [Candidatus Paceibacterota bacterium]|nr:hypothetical protein [Candidatus Paceibacterota bacterium]